MLGATSLFKLIDDRLADCLDFGDHIDYADVIGFSESRNDLKRFMKLQIKQATKWSQSVYPVGSTLVLVKITGKDPGVVFFETEDHFEGYTIDDGIVANANVGDTISNLSVKEYACPLAGYCNIMRCEVMPLTDSVPFVRSAAGSQRPVSPKI